MRHVTVSGQGAAGLLWVLVLLGAAACGAAPAPDAPHITMLSPDEHDAIFPITWGRHDGIDCNVCHGDFAAFDQFTCMTGGCHTPSFAAEKHRGVRDFVYRASACYACHPTGKG